MHIQKIVCWSLHLLCLSAKFESCTPCLWTYAHSAASIMNMVNRMLVVACNKGSPLANLYSNRSVTGIPNEQARQLLFLHLAPVLWHLACGSAFGLAQATHPPTHQALCKPQLYTPSLLQATPVDEHVVYPAFCRPTHVYSFLNFNVHCMSFCSLRDVPSMGKCHLATMSTSVLAHKCANPPSLRDVPSMGKCLGHHEHICTGSKVCKSPSTPCTSNSELFEPHLHHAIHQVLDVLLLLR